MSGIQKMQAMGVAEGGRKTPPASMHNFTAWLRLMAA
jgi:hypothetical protein